MSRSPKGGVNLNRQLRADLMLMMITVFWGASYMLTKLALDVLQPFNLTAVRFIIAFIVSALVFHKKIIRADKQTIKYSVMLAIILLFEFISMTFGLQYTTASNSGFLVSLSVVIIPILSAIFLKQKIEKQVLIGVCTAPIGIALLTLNSELSVNSGDILSIICALLFAVHVVATGVFTQRVDPVVLGVFQLGFVGLFSLIVSMFTEPFKLPDTTVSWVSVLSLAILCTAVGYIVQTTAQQHTSATHTGLILSLEPVFSAVFAYFVLGELFTIKGYIGAAILLFSVLIAEVDFKRKNDRKEKLDI